MFIPSDVLKSVESVYLENYKVITKNTDKLLLFAGDQKIEHLNNDFYGSFIHPDVNNPEHLFQIANEAKIGAFATQLGLISRYANKYKNINFIAKLNSKTDLISTQDKDPLSTALWQIDDVIDLKENSEIKIRGVGYTIYIGSKYENIMLSEAAKIIFEAHKKGLITIIWIYPRGQHLKSNEEIDLCSGAAGIANALGADFVKIKAPMTSDLLTQTKILKIAAKAAGNTKIICSGGESKPTDKFLKELFEQIKNGETSGCATGRNIFQRSLKDAIAFTNAISSIVYENKTSEEALEIYQS